MEETNKTKIENEIKELESIIKQTQDEIRKSKSEDEKEAYGFKLMYFALRKIRLEKELNK